MGNTAGQKVDAMQRHKVAETEMTLRASHRKYQGASSEEGTLF